MRLTVPPSWPKYSLFPSSGQIAITDRTPFTECLSRPSCMQGKNDIFWAVKMKLPSYSYTPSSVFPTVLVWTHRNIWALAARRYGLLLTGVIIINCVPTDRLPSVMSYTSYTQTALRPGSLSLCLTFSDHPVTEIGHDGSWDQKRGWVCIDMRSFSPR